MRPADIEYAPYYETYVRKVTESKVVPVLEAQPGELIELASRISADQERLRYEPDKWSVRQTLGHLIDTERVMGYRAFCISRGEQKPLPGFDQNGYVNTSHYDERSVTDIVEEFAAVRTAHLWVIRHWTPEEWSRSGNANGKAVTARAIAFIMAGHVRHHVAILREKYGIGR